MKYLTKVLVGKREAAALRLKDAYAWHQAIWAAFPGRDDKRRDFLFRLDHRQQRFRLYILSPHQPIAPDWGNFQSKAIAPSFLEHERYRFQLRANPTMRRVADRRRLGIYDEERLREWIVRKAEANGFDVESGMLAILPPIDETFVRNGRRGKHVRVDFQGMLRVTDREVFGQAFQKGIGSAKAFGFGLLMLAPITLGGQS